jgi:hypothetical protein
MSLIDEAHGVRQRIAERLRELEPLVAEYHQLRQLAADMGVPDEEPAAVPAPGPSPTPATTRRRRRTSAGSGRAGGGSPSRSRRAPRSQPEVTPASGSSDLAQRVLEAVHSDPGRTVADYSEILGVAPTALYRPVRELTTEGALLKRARQLFPADA